MSRRRPTQLDVLNALMDALPKPRRYERRIITDPVEAERLGVKVGHTLEERVVEPFRVHLS